MNRYYDKRLRMANLTIFDIDTYMKISPTMRKKILYYTSSKTDKLYDRPHYSNSDFDNEVLIFGRDSPELFFNYDDRIMSCDAEEEANASGAEQHTAQWYENYLTAFHGKQCDLQCIYAGVNRSSGMSYLRFGYIIKP